MRHYILPEPHAELPQLGSGLPQVHSCLILLIYLILLTTLQQGFNSPIPIRPCIVLTSLSLSSSTVERLKKINIHTINLSLQFSVRLNYDPLHKNNDVPCSYLA